MSNRIWFNRVGDEWLTEGDTSFSCEWEADRVLAQAGLLSNGAFSEGGWRFKDPLRAAAVLRLAGFEVLPWE